MSSNILTPAESYPDLRLSWDNLVWNLELAEDVDDEEAAIDAARDAVLATLVEVCVCGNFTLVHAFLCLRVPASESASASAYLRVSYPVVVEHKSGLRGLA